MPENNHPLSQSHITTTKQVYR